MSELLIGCGSKWDKRINTRGTNEWQKLTTLDNNGDHKPNIIHDLELFPYPFDDNTFDEIHAYEVLEHTGNQGDYHFFFNQFSEFWRILKDGGLFCATVPHYKSKWAWGDPSHKRIINQGSLAFLCQEEYNMQVGVTTLSDFRHLYKADFDIKQRLEQGEDSFIFILQAIKPSRYICPRENQARS